ncbi:unnamed protein product [Phaeothamnion confervicola]
MFGIPFKHLPIPAKTDGGKRVQELQIEEVRTERPASFVFHRALDAVSAFRHRRRLIPPPAAGALPPPVAWRRHQLAGLHTLPCRCRPPLPMLLVHRSLLLLRRSFTIATARRWRWLVPSTALSPFLLRCRRA